MNIKEQIKEQRPNIKDSTVDSYFQYLKKIYQTLHETNENPKNVNYLADFDGIEQIMEQYKPNTKKNYYSAAVVALKAFGKDPKLIAKYEAIRDEKQLEYDTMAKANSKTEKQKQNWVSLNEYDGLLDKYREQIKLERLFSKSELSKKENEISKEYIILLTYRHLPMRNDFANMRVLTPRAFKKLPAGEQDKNNYLVGTSQSGYKFHINDYKTKKTFGNKVIDIPSEIQKDFKKYLSKNTSGYFLVDQSGRPITPNGITKLLNKIFKREFGKNVSSSLIRHIVLSEKYGKTLQDMKDDSEIMGHSVLQGHNYTKTD
jgi:hypothetical protein